MKLINSLPAVLTILLSTADVIKSSPVSSSPDQLALQAPHHLPNHSKLLDAQTIRDLASPEFDVIALLKELEPEKAHELDEPRFLRIFGEEHGKWMTEGDKVVLRRMGRKFIDLTGREDRIPYEDLASKNQSKSHDVGERLSLMSPHHRQPADRPCLVTSAWPKIQHQEVVRSVFPHMTTHSMHDTLQTLSSFYSRYYRSEHGRKSQEWLFREILKVGVERRANRNRTGVESS